MTLFQILTLFVGSATWFTAFVGLLNLLTLRRQQKILVTPQLTLVRQSIFARRAEGSAESDFIWSEEAPPAAGDGAAASPSASSDGVSVRFRSADRYAIRVFNLGSGAAKNIDAEWTWSIRELVDGLNRIAHKSSADSYQEYDQEKQTLSFRGRGRQGYFFLSNDLTRHQDYILPCSIENRGHSFELPSSFIALISEYISVLFVSKEDNWQDFQGLAELSLLLKFDDLVGNHHSRKFNVKFELESATPGFFTASLTPSAAKQ